MNAQHTAEVAYVEAAYLRSAPKDAFGEIRITPARALRIARLLDQLARPVEQRKEQPCHQPA